MRNSWTHFFRRLATVALVSGSLAWSSALCYAQLASDNASDPVYADGWQAGDNGGTGFQPWNFDTDFLPPDEGPQQRMDGVPPATPSTFNAFETAWTLYNTSGPPGGDVARAGRGFAPLQVGQTIRVVFDNPSERRFFRGYFVRFNSRNGEPGGGSLCYGGTACSFDTTPTPKVGLQMFEYLSYGQWGVIDRNPMPDPGDPDDINRFTFATLFDEDTADMGAQLDLEITGTDTYQLTLTPLADPAAAYTQSGLLLTPGEPIDWLEFTFFNTATAPGVDADFFIRSIEIIGPAPEGVPGDYNDNGAVDAADYVAWRNGGPLQNEVAGVTPGQVTADDYAAWRARFGNTSPAAAGLAAQGVAVPEPSTFLYLVVVAAGVACIGFERGRQVSAVTLSVTQYKL
jgi:hypothetical protein